MITVRGGDQWRPFVHVADAALAMAKVLSAPREAVQGQTFNVGSNDSNYRIIDVGRQVLSVVPTATLLDLPADGDRRNYRVSFDKARRQLGFQARWTVLEGIRQVKQAFDAGRVADWQAAQYSNYKTMASSRDTYRRPSSRVGGRIICARARLHIPRPTRVISLLKRASPQLAKTQTIDLNRHDANSSNHRLVRPRAWALQVCNVCIDSGDQDGANLSRAT